MAVKLDMASPVPLYMQIKNQIIIAIASGDYKPGARLPSVRAFAEELEVNMHTVNKAYLLLRDEGYITLDRRRGGVISESPKEASEKFIRQLSDELLPAAAGAKCMGMGRKEFRKLCTQIYESFDENKD